MLRLLQRSGQLLVIEPEELLRHVLQHFQLVPTNAGGAA
jgi:hypothetical protein